MGYKKSLRRGSLFSKSMQLGRQNREYKINININVLEGGLSPETLPAFFSTVLNVEVGLDDL